MGLFKPQNADTFQRLNLFNVAPEAVKHELRAGHPVNDFVVQNAETMPQAKAVNLNFEQGIHRLFNFVLDLTSAAETEGVFICQENCNPRGIPRLRR